MKYLEINHDIENADTPCGAFQNFKIAPPTTWFQVSNDNTTYRSSCEVAMKAKSSYMKN